jgi:hypothetical protein
VALAKLDSVGQAQLTFVESTHNRDVLTYKEAPPKRGFVLRKARFAVRKGLAAAAGASALHAAVAASVAGHDGSAGGAAWGVSHVDHGLHGSGGVVDAAVFHGER